MQSFPSYTYCKVSICFSFKGKVISSFSLSILILSSIFSWTIFLCAYLPENNLRRIATTYLRGYWKASENDRVVTIGSANASSIFFSIFSLTIKDKTNRFLHESLLKIWDFFHECEKT